MKKGRRLWYWVRHLLTAFVLLVIIVFCVLEGIVITGSGSSKEQEADVVVILGAMVYQRGPSPILVRRMDAALDYLETHPDVVVVTSGGKGADEPESEAKAMSDYLTKHGIDPDRIILEDQSCNTYQNLINTAAQLKKRGYKLDATRLLIVTNGFHLTRVRMLSKRCGLQIATLAAPMPNDWKNTLYCYSRETVALVKSFVLDRGKPTASMVHWEPSESIIY